MELSADAVCTDCLAAWDPSGEELPQFAWVIRRLPLLNSISLRKIMPCAKQLNVFRFQRCAAF